MVNDNSNATNFASGCMNVPATQDTLSAPAILLIDDDPRMLDSLRLLLDGRGFQMTSASNGAEAIRHLSATPFDLVLLDLNLSDMHGHEIMDFINDRNIDVSIIVLSGETSIDAAIGALQRGAYGYLRKPYAVEELLNRINNALQKRSLEARNRHIAWRLEYSEKIYRNLVDNSPDIIYTLDRSGRFTFVNERALQVLGFRLDELLGQHYSMIVHEDDLGRAQYVFHERRVGNRASRNVELRLKSNNIDAEELTFDQTLMTISFNSMGMYQQSDEVSTHDYFGTYVVARDVTDRKRAEELISYQAYHDILTDLPNRILFKDQLSLAIIQARRTQTKLAVMLINLDRFKLINDTMGHVKGDELLQHVAHRLKSCMYKGAMLARHGGDEFTVILPCMHNRQEAVTLADDILKAMKQPFLLDGEDARITASIGIAVYPTDAININDLIRHADIAMYQVKAQSKDGYVFYEASMQDASQENIAKEKSLRSAVERNELEMYYQPQIETSTGKIIGAEALMRWNHPERGLLAAGMFLPFAEENGLMLPLSDWMLDAVCQDMKAMREAGCSPIRVAINISPQSLDHTDLLPKIQDTLDQYGIPPKQLEVEITENICIRNPQYVIEQLTKLSQLGICIAIDDFGTGYSSLAYLHRFPINTIKIDQAFVREVQSEDGHFPVARAIISIALGLGLNLIAEGVETEIQANYLKQSGCETMQGYLFYKPMPRGQLIELLKAQADA